MVALGKLCLVDAELTKRVLPIFMKELASNEQLTVRNNSLIALFDLIKRHAAILDRHIPSIALAMTDQAALVGSQPHSTFNRKPLSLSCLAFLIIA